MKWDARLYDTGHSFVSKYGEEVVSLLNPRPGENILDVGCGTGDLANLIAQSGAYIEGIDASEEMITKAKEKFPAMSFRVADITRYEKPGFYDAIFSNATLHWIQEKEQAAQKIYANLKAGGRFVLEMGGKGNVAEIIKAIKHSLEKYGHAEKITQRQWYFPSIGEYATVLESVGFRVRYAIHFDRETLLESSNGIKDWIRMFGKDFLQGIDESITEAILTETENLLKPTRYYNNKWYADYKRLRMVATKEF